MRITPRVAAPLFAFLLSSCAATPQGSGLSRPWIDAGEVRAIQQPDGTSAPQVRGVWQSRGYGRLLAIDKQGVTQYEIGDTCYLPPSEDAQSEMDSIGYRFFRMMPDGDSAIFQLLRGDTMVLFDRIAELPAQCRDEPDTGPKAVAAALLDAFERHYAFFDRRPPDHDTRAAKLRDAMRPGIDDGALWDTLALYMEGLSDSHTKLIGEIDGERRRIQDGQGETLPRERARKGGESAWLVGLIEQATQKLGDTAHHTGRDRIVWGTIEGRVGYLQIFQMGGFTDREDFGSDAWAEAEMAEFDRIMDEAFSVFQDADAVIIDLSNNRGGWDRIAKALPGRVTDRAYTGFTTRTRGSGLAPYPHRIEPADGARFSGPVYVLTSDVTVSGGELATLALRQNPNVIQIGKTTRGAFSTPLAKRLPNGWLLELSNEIFAAPDGTVYEETGLPPQVDIAVYPDEDPVAGHWRAVEAVVAMTAHE